ncbi:MAG: glucoamylase family protein [Elusimicrobiota bacterium]
MIRFALIFSLLFVIFMQIRPVPVNAAPAKNPLPVNITTSPEDTEYLRDILKETFASIYYNRHPVTGICSYLPEKPDLNELMKTENIFLSFASVAIAGKIGLIPDEEARKEIEKTLYWLEKIPTAQGFQLDCVHTSDGSAGDNVVYALGDLGFNSCCLILVGEAYPEFKPRTEKLVNAMNWGGLYNKDAGFLAGVIRINTANNSLETIGTGMLLACDQRLAIFMAIAAGGAPPKLWDNMPRYYLSRYGVKYMKPGEGLGFGEQVWAGSYFLDERGSEIGKSCANMAWAQINYAQDMGYPAWGWSNCLSPVRYMGFGDPGTDWSIINPHAVGAAVVYYPNQVAKAFRAMEKLGVREPISAGGKKRNFGLRSSIDVDTNESPEQVIAGLDQPFIFMSLANYLYDGVVWKHFRANKTVQNGINRIEEYRKPKQEYLKLYEKRDIEGPVLPKSKINPAAPPLVIDSFDNDINDLDGARIPRAATFQKQRGSAKITFKTNDEKVSYLTEDLVGTDLSGYNALKLVARADRPGKIMLTMRISGEGGYRPVDVTTEWKELIIPFRSFMGGKDGFDYGSKDPKLRWTGMWHDRTSGDEIGIGPFGVNSLELKEISFIALPADKLYAAAKTLKTIPETFIEKDGTLDRMDDKNAWKTLASGTETRLNLSHVKGVRGDALACDFSFGKQGGWILLNKEVNLTLNKDSIIVFNLKAEGGPATLEVKVIDSTGATYMKEMKNGVKNSSVWTEIKIKSSELVYGWGGVKNDKPGKLKEFHFAIASKDGASAGRAYFDELRIIQTK